MGQQRSSCACSLTLPVPILLIFCELFSFNMELFSTKSFTRQTAIELATEFGYTPEEVQILFKEHLEAATEYYGAVLGQTELIEIATERMIADLPSAFIDETLTINSEVID